MKEITVVGIANSASSNDFVSCSVDQRWMRLFLFTCFVHFSQASWCGFSLGYSTFPSYFSLFPYSNIAN